MAHTHRSWFFLVTSKLGWAPTRLRVIPVQKYLVWSTPPMSMSTHPSVIKIHDFAISLNFCLVCTHPVKIQPPFFKQKEKINSPVNKKWIQGHYDFCLGGGLWHVWLFNQFERNLKWFIWNERIRFLTDWKKNFLIKRYCNNFVKHAKCTLVHTIIEMNDEISCATVIIRGNDLW